MSLSYLTAVRSSDADNTRRRTGTLPPQPTRNVPLTCWLVGAAMGWLVGFLCGLGVL